MIQNYVQRRFGLDVVVQEILSSKHPLRTLAENHAIGQSTVFVPIDILTFAAFNSENAEHFVKRWFCKDGVSLDLNPRIALEYLANGVEYLDVGDDTLRQAFPFGEQEYHFVDVKGNWYNPSFTLAVFPKETVGIAQKQQMIQDYALPRLFNPEKYEHIKSIVFTDGSGYYIAVVKGGEKIDFTEISLLLHIDKDKIKLAPREKVADIVGREVGGVSPLIYSGNFKNIMAVFISRDLLNEGYAEPHYSLVLDKRSALTISDFGDVYNIINSTRGFPHIFLFRNNFQSDYQ